MDVALHNRGVTALFVESSGLAIVVQRLGTIEDEPCQASDGGGRDHATCACRNPPGSQCRHTAGGVVIAVACGTTPSTNHPQSGGFTGDSVNIRTGPHTGCTSRGLGYRGHTVTYHCYAFGDTVNGWTTWTYLTDNTTGVKGWSSDYYLKNGGGSYPC